MQQTPHWLEWGAPDSPLKLPLPLTDPQTQYLPNPWTTISNRICSAVLPCTGQTAETDRPTDGLRECSMTIGRFHSIESIVA